MSFTPAADGFANDLDLDGTFDSLDTTSQLMNVRLYPPSAGIGEDRALLEFNLASVAPASRVTSARLNICANYLVPSKTPRLDIYGYAGDGALTKEDAVRQATKIGSVSVSNLNPQSVLLDAAFFQSMLGAGPYVGVILRVGAEKGALLHSTESSYPTKRPVLVLDTQSLVSDFGDAPASYPTASGGGLAPAQHEIQTGFWLGGGVDSEADGQPDAAAAGDDTREIDDEDGVAFSSALIPGSDADIEVTASAIGKLDAWIDFSADGDWADSGEQVFTGQPLAAGANHLSFPVPASSATGQTFARFRFSSAGGLSCSGLAADGEVEDYAVSISPPQPGGIRGTMWNDLNGDRVLDEGEPGLAGWTAFLDANGNHQLDQGETTSVTGADGRYSFSDLAPGDYLVDQVVQAGWLRTHPADPFGQTAVVSSGQTTENVNFGNREPLKDFGDAADSPYPTLLANDGAAHYIAAGLYLGSGIDAEPDGQPAGDATGDDSNGPVNDEDGVEFTSLLAPGETATIEVTASAEGKLDAWIDFDGDGSWNQAADQVFAAHPLVAGVNTLNIPVPDAAAASGKTFARFRFSSAGGLSFTGLATDGEVEDYQVVVQPPVFRGGTEEDHFRFSTDGATHSVTVEDTTKTFDAGTIRLIRFDGQLGSDAIIVRGGPGDEAAALGQDFGTITGPGYTLVFTSVEQVKVEAGAGVNQVATIEDGDTDDTLYGIYDAAKGCVRASMYYDNIGAVQVWGFQTVEGKSVHQGTNQVILVDGPGNDTFTGGPGDSSLQYAVGGTIRAVGFPNVYANAIFTDPDGNDRAILDDSADADQYIAAPGLAYMNYNHRAAGRNFALGFNVVEAHSTSGGADSAQFFDSAASDTFVADPQARTSSMTDGATYTNLADGFQAVYARSTDGDDEAKLSGTSDRDTIVAALRPGCGAATNYGYLLASTAQVYTYNFSHWTVDAAQDANDATILLDSSDNDRLTGGPASVKLESLAASGPWRGRWVQVNGAISVGVSGGSGAGRDAADLTDSAANDIFWGEPRNAHFSYGTGQFLHLTGFADVTATAATTAQGGRDYAYLYDSATASADDTLAAGPTSARMTDAAGTYANTASGFGSLFAYSRSGQDTATLTGSPGNDVLAVTPGGHAGVPAAAQAIAQFKCQDGDQVVAFGFRSVEAEGGTGGTADVAYLNDSTGNDLLTLTRTAQTLETAEGNDPHCYVRTSGFDQVYGRSRAGGRDKAVFEDEAGLSNFFYGSQARSYLYYAKQALLNAADAFEEVEVTFRGGGDQVVLAASKLLAERLTNTTRKDLVLEDTGPEVAYRIAMDGLDTLSKLLEARLQKNKDGSDQDSATLGNPTAVDYLFSVGWEEV